MFSIKHEKDRTRTYVIPIFEDDGSTDVVLAAEDEVYFIATDRFGNIVLQADSITPADGGSRMTFTAGTNDTELLISQVDTRSIDEGVAFDCEVSVIDNSEAVSGEKKIKHVETGVLVLHPSRGGTLTDEQSSSSSSG